MVYRVGQHIREQKNPHTQHVPPHHQTKYMTANCTAKLIGKTLSVPSPLHTNPSHVDERNKLTEPLRMGIITQQRLASQSSKHPQLTQFKRVPIPTDVPYTQQARKITNVARVHDHNSKTNPLPSSERARLRERSPTPTPALSHRLHLEYNHICAPATRTPSLRTTPQRHKVSSLT
jgi:hypothetical protein